MEILAHRGLWLERDEKNSLPALFRGLENGYGLETDVRDLNGRLVISHDMPISGRTIPLEQLLRRYAGGGFAATLGLNIKSDGLQEKLLGELKDHGIKRYFVFDMSVPDTLGYLKLNMPTFIRRSDLEHHPELALRAQGTWLDEMMAPWVDAGVVREQALESGAVCIVSAELHGRAHASQWEQIERAINSGCPSDKLLLCTDFPHEAKRFFK